MSNTNAEILQALVSDDGDIAVLRGPTHEYKEHISVRRADGSAMRFAVFCSRKTLDDLVKANFVKQDGPENERQITMFKLTDDGREAAAGSPLKNSLKAKLLKLGYWWPHNLKGKSITWLKAEIEAIKTDVNRGPQTATRPSGI
jgi:hypothetical protein